VRELPAVKFKFIWPSAPNFISLRDSLVQRLASFNVPNSIEVLDKQSRADLFAYIQIADCVVVPSLAEGFGYAAIEACLLAKRTVVTKAGSLPEVANGNVNLVEPASHKALSEGIITAFHKHTLTVPIKVFRNESMVQNHLTLYQQMMGE
jgi:glycosyltransferase involved in cell wall biosynthesis